MRRRWLIAAAIVVLCAVVVLVLRIVDSEYDNSRRTDAHTESCESEYNGIIVEVTQGVCEVLVEFGDVPRSATVVKSIRVVNGGKEPLLLLDYSTQCRCMWLDFERTAIAPGEHIDIELTFDSRGEWGSVGNYMEVTTSREATPMAFWIAAEVE